MRAIADIFDRIKLAVNEMGVSSYYGALQHGIEGAQNLSDTKSTLIDLYVSQYYTSNENSPFRKLLSYEEAPGNTIDLGDFRISVRLPGKKYIRKVGEIYPVISVLFVDETLLADKIQIQKILLKSQSYSINIVIHNNIVASELRDLTRGLSNRVQAAVLEELGETSLSEYLSNILSAEAREELKLKSYLFSLEPIILLLNESIDHENHLISVRKNINNQLTTALKKDESRMNLSEFSSNLKSFVQQKFNEAERDMRSKYDDFNKPNIGEFSKLSHHLAQEINDFIKRDLAEKSERVGINLDENFVITTEKQVQKTLKINFVEDSQQLESMMKSVDDELKKMFQNKGISYQSPGSMLPAPTIRDKVVNTYARYTKFFSGELIKKGAMEYFVALRDYTGLIMVVAGLLAPLNMISSISDNPTLKKMSIGIRICTGAITLIMVIYGFYDLRKRIPKKRKEEFDREILRARDFISTENKKLFSESSREWVSILIANLKDQYNSYILSIEKTIKLYIATTQENLNGEKIKIQKAGQGLDVNLKKISNADRSKDQLNTRFRDLDSENRKQLRTLLG